MFDLGLGIGEIIVLALVALIVVGPKELPNLFYKTGQFIGRLRAMASEFKYAMDDIAHEQEIAKVKTEIEAQQKLMNDSVKPAPSSAISSPTAPSPNIADSEGKSNET